jgi:uncharacterized protein (DUF1330 family)
MKPINLDKERLVRIKVNQSSLNPLKIRRPTVSVYLIIEIEVKNRELYSQYVEKVPGVINKHGGKYLVRGGNVTPMMGDWKPERLILIEFDSADQIHGCFQSPEYLQLAPLREQSTVSKSIIVEGCTRTPTQLAACQSETHPD